MMRIDGHWKLDRRVPIAVIATLVLQIIGATIWATQLDARVTHVEAQSAGNDHLDERFARLEERLEYLKENVYAIRRELEQLSDRPLKK